MSSNPKLPPKKMKTRGLTRDALINLEKNDLIDMIIRLESHREQLKNKLNKTLRDGNDTGTSHNNKKKFDFTKCHFRRVLIRILYFGWKYHGLAAQEDSNETIEHHLFYALKKSCLIESREKSEYERCGRTDKGVSSFGQVISITIRSNHELSIQNEESFLSSELPYCKILNRILPDDIRAVAWKPIPGDITNFSARFNCKRRQYKYYFPKSSLDVEAMRDACHHLIGEHDFRNLCKMDVANNVTNFRREIISAVIIPFEKEDYDKATSMYTLVIESNGFLYHQIRCIMAVLFLVGQGSESPNIINELLDIDKHPRKPQYSMALDIPLNLFHCTYDIDGEWYYDEQEIKNVIAKLQTDWSLHSIKSSMIKDCMSNLEVVLDTLIEKKSQENNTLKERVMAHSNCLVQGVKSKTYVPLLARETCASLEERIDHYTRKRKIGDIE